jgi:hypothetical protein
MKIKIATFLTALLLAMSPVLAVYDLGDYPGFLFDNHNLDAYVVYGNDAAVSDVVGGTDLAIRLAGESYEEVSSGGSTTVVSGGKSEDIPIGKALAATNYLDVVMDDTDLGGLLDSSVTFQSESYNYRELVVLGSSTPAIHSSLTGSDDDYKSDIYMETASSGALAYYWVFDEAIQVNASTSTNPLEMDFLGKTMKITSVSTATKFTAYVGDSFFMNVGDSVTVEGKTVTLDRVGSSGTVIVDIDGTTYTVSGTQARGGIEITIDDYFYSDTPSDCAATLVMGKQSSETYQDGDVYSKNDSICDNDPNDTDCWEWDIAGLKTNSATTVGSTGPSGGPYIGIRSTFVVNDDTDNPISAGECFSFPNGYVEVCFDSLTVADDDYMTLTLEAPHSVELDGSTVNALYLKTSVEDGITLNAAGITGLSSDVRSDQVWLLTNSSNYVFLFYRSSDGAKTSAGYVTNASSVAYAADNFAEMTYGNTKDTNVQLDLSGAVGTANAVNLTFNILGKTTTDLGDSYDDIRVQLKHTGGGAFAGLGSTASTEEADEVAWCGGTGTCTWTNVGTKDEDHRTMYGIIIENPESHGASDEVVLKIPNEQLFAKVVVKGPTTTVTSTSSDGVKQVVPITNAVAKLDTEVSLPVEKHLVLVGGPGVNKLTAQAMGYTYPTYGSQMTGEEFGAGEGFVKVFEDVLETGYVAVVVAGWSASDTRNAASVLQQFGSFSEQLDGNVAVKVTSVSASGITAAA